jgi:hypothetical protein
MANLMAISAGFSGRPAQGRATAWRPCPASPSTLRARAHNWRPGWHLNPSLSLAISFFTVFSTERAATGGERRPPLWTHPNPSTIVQFILAIALPWAPPCPRPHRATIFAQSRAHRDGSSTVSPFLLSAELARGRASWASYHIFYPLLWVRLVLLMLAG